MRGGEMQLQGAFASRSFTAKQDALPAWNSISYDPVLRRDGVVVPILYVYEWERGCGVLLVVGLGLLVVACRVSQRRIKANIDKLTCSARIDIEPIADVAAVR